MRLCASSDYVWDQLGSAGDANQGLSNCWSRSFWVHVRISVWDFHAMFEGLQTTGSMLPPNAEGTDMRVVGHERFSLDFPLATAGASGRVAG
jgi:hypothetical protein